MDVLASESTYKDQRAMTLQTDQIAAQFLPHIGAKMCSLVHRPTGMELLVQRPWDHYRVAPYDGDYVAQGECSGLDDMFPTIDRCCYDRYPWLGTPIPDHGEVWSIPWEYAVEGERLYCAVHGVRFPYRLEKWISFSAPGVLRTDYRLTNFSSFDFDFLWAAHPMFVLEEGAEVTLPTSVRQVCTVISLSAELGRYGDRFDWPLAKLTNGLTRDLSRMRPKSAHDAAKFYVVGKLQEGWCSLSYPKSRLILTLRFPVEQVPYLGILPNEGGFQDLYNVFLEPATASFDRPDVARLHGELSTVGARSTYEWYLELALAGDER